MSRAVNQDEIAADHLARLFQDRPHLAARATDIELIQSISQRATYRLTWDGRAAIAKQIWHDNRANAVTGQSAALKEMGDHLNRDDAKARVPEVLHVAPKAGFFVIARVPGENARQILRREGEAALPRVARAAQLWMTAASGLHKEVKPFPHTRIAKQLDALSQGIAADVAERTRALLFQAPDALTWSAGHGDLWPPNLMLDGDSVTAIDLAGPRNYPVVEDLARFARELTEYSESGLTDRITDPLLAGLLPDDARAFPIYYGVALAQNIEASGGLKHGHERARFLGL
ncbi:MAG: phosphotransferase [Rhodobacteraceae bacterium]|uniref:phosphotransferase n=1 Tax=Celeribacter sp. HF31 TaxID=2721558 RepID=UPI0014303143|nr:phosphotransferase [Celeribacter sp. HF31]NIY78192.1 phosphotransferase [Celeribacter sp. HF31]NVK46558.1 phosphotransferase [Paracoccaceae bacterium]